MYIFFNSRFTWSPMEIGMESPELLNLVENWLKGLETLVTRIIHILMERTAPSPELVNKVRDLYISIRYRPNFS